jgi:hypothetical protein
MIGKKGRYKEIPLNIIMLKNERCYCKQTLPWTRGLINYFENNSLVAQHKYYSKTWLTRFVYPFVWGWKVDDFTFMPINSKTLFQNLDTNWSPQLEMTYLKKPWYQNTWSRNNLVVFSSIIDLLHGMKWTILFKQSTTTRMESKELESDKSMMKFMEIEIHGAKRMSNDWTNPCGWWWAFFVNVKTPQDPTNSFTYFQSYGHQ